MRELDVKPELEIYDTGHLEVCMSLLEEGLLAEPLQFSIVMGVRGGMAATPENLITMVRRLPPGATLADHRHRQSQSAAYRHWSGARR